MPASLKHAAVWRLTASLRHAYKKHADVKRPAEEPQQADVQKYADV